MCDVTPGMQSAIKSGLFQYGDPVGHFSPFVTGTLEGSLEDSDDSNDALEGFFFFIVFPEDLSKGTTDDTCVTCPFKVSPERAFHGVSKTAASKRTLPLLNPSSEAV